jgi:hypothetical protein
MLARLPANVSANTTWATLPATLSSAIRVIVKNDFLAKTIMLVNFVICFCTTA